MQSKEYLRFKELVEEHLLYFLPEVDHKSITLYESMTYSLQAGGKLLRPVLLLAACDFCGGEEKLALPYACAIEYIHTYSLIHDDLPAMDDDDLRRGIPTNHKVFGEAIAILAGDGLLTSAFEAMNKDMLLYFDNTEKLKRRVRAVYEISKGAGCRGMIAGQVADMETENKQCSKELLDYIHVNKTAALIKAAVRAGAHLAGADKKTLGELDEYAENLGLAFQIADDILDIDGDVEKLGKNTGVDLIKKKSTYPCLYGLEESKLRVRELTDNAKRVMEPYYDNAEFFVELAEELANRVK
ncbi:polyprenyl synthetase family protein [Sinanaerobacter chloroacetimidivorans]|uniref:Farnesyl diphosphate synthase n=1 Tax=Sinanaerobacter chloroacetimidivorans TaxID=2818044 RepID=A0A8J8AZK2_9FIRM|nr:farnesyl diphosphate synthase [Sinanaerobacter chloroacetimidivorans]MBR0596618.1 polyprenyl synthetase family protein [Sinanaerobacter chloroacetimidivorans]